jgi:hypothetical protein
MLKSIKETYKIQNAGRHDIMGKRSLGIRYLDLGEQWRRLYLTGSPIQQIANTAGEHAQTVSRAIWLAKVPSDVKTLIRENPEVFTRRILLNTFAAKRMQCEKDSFKLLRSEVQRLISTGAGTKPKLQKKIKLKKRPKNPFQKNNILILLILHMR